MAGKGGSMELRKLLSDMEDVDVDALRQELTGNPPPAELRGLCWKVGEWEVFSAWGSSRSSPLRLSLVSREKRVSSKLFLARC